MTQVQPKIKSKLLQYDLNYQPATLSNPKVTVNTLVLKNILRTFLLSFQW